MAIVLGILLLLQVLVVSVGDEAATYGTGRHHRRRWSVTQTILGDRGVGGDTYLGICTVLKYVETLLQH